MMKAFDEDVYGYDFEAEGAKQVSQQKREKLASNIFDFGMKMYLRDNFAHADFHAGNMLAKDDGSIIVLDTGCVTTLRSDVGRFYDFMEASGRQNAEEFS